MDNDVNEFLLAGADSVLAKPLRCEVLNQIVNYVNENGFSAAANKGTRLSFSESDFTHRLFKLHIS